MKGGDKLIDNQFEEAINNLTSTVSNLSSAMAGACSSVNTQALNSVLARIQELTRPAVEQNKTFCEYFSKIALSYSTQLDISLEPLSRCLKEICAKTSFNLNELPIFSDALVDLLTPIKVSLYSLSKQLSEINLPDLDNLKCRYFDQEGTALFTETVNGVTEEINNLGCFNECLEPPIPKEQSSKLTFEKSFAIISLLITLLEFILNRGPNPQLNVLISGVNSLIQIQQEQLELLKDIHEDLHLIGDSQSQVIPINANDDVSNTDGHENAK